METITTSVTPVSAGMRYGALLAVSAVLTDFLVRIAGFSFMAFGIAAGFGTVLVSVVWLVLAHAAFKKANGNLMSFGQGLTIAIVMLLISGIVSGLFNYAYLHFIDPDFVEHMKAGMVKFMEQNNVPDEQIEKSTSRLDEMNVGIGKALLNGLGGGLGSGVVLGSIVSIFTKRNAPAFE